MIVERLTFQAKFGQGDSVVAGFKEWRDKLGPRYGLSSRLMVDVTGPMFTIIVETEYKDMDQVAEMERQMTEGYSDPEFQRWFASWSQLVETGGRELFRVID